MFPLTTFHLIVLFYGIYIFYNYLDTICFHLMKSICFYFMWKRTHFPLRDIIQEVLTFSEKQEMSHQIAIVFKDNEEEAIQWV